MSATETRRGIVDFSALLLGTLGYTDDEFASLGYEAADGFRTAVYAPAEAIAAAAQLPADRDCYFGVNPTEGPARRNSRRGKSENATRLSGLWSDIDVKPGACETLDIARAIIAEVSIIIGTRPSVIVESGGGLHPYWSVEDGDDLTAARGLPKRFGRLVAAVADRHGVGIKVDSVYDMARMMRLPGSNNMKTGQPRPAVAHLDAGRPLTLGEIAERLDEFGIPERPDDIAGSEEVSPPADWVWAETTCNYTAKMIAGFATDTPKNPARNPWLLSQRVRLACAHRLGCITETDYQQAESNLQKRFAEIVNDPKLGDPREVKKFEHRDTRKCAITKAAAKTDEQARAELGGHTHHTVGAEAADTGEDEAVKTVPWPTLSGAALHGTAGRIVNMVTPHTEADPAALLVSLLAVFGATLGASPHFIAGNDRHQAVIHPLIVGRTNSGAKGTSLGVVEAVRRQALPWFDEFTTSGLSSAEGLIEMVRDPSGDPGDKDYDPGIADKRLLVKESEYRSVLARCRREGNTLTPTLRQAWDGGTLRTLTRKHNKLTATDPHIVVLGHITPREFRAVLDDSDLSGGSVNRMLICLSRRSRLHARLGNMPTKVLAAAGELFDKAQKKAQHRQQVTFTDEFWAAWEPAYRHLNRDRPDSWATDATARGVTQVLRLALLYALFNGEDQIGVEHLEAALALWSYAEHSARWLFSTHEQEVHRENAGGLAAFIRDGGGDGRSRTEIYQGYFHGNSKAAEVTAALTPLVHEGTIIEIRDETAGRPSTRYVHRTQRINGLTENAGQDYSVNTYSTDLRTDPTAGGGLNPYKSVPDTYSETPPEQHNPLNPLIRSPEATEETDRCQICTAELWSEKSIARGYCERCHLDSPDTANSETAS